MLKYSFLTVLAITWGSLSFSETHSDGAITGQLRGAETYNESIGEAMFADSFAVSNLLGLTTPQGRDLEALFGEYPSEGARERLSATATAVSMFIWKAMAQSLAKGLGQVCDQDTNQIAFGPQIFTLKDDFAETIRELCSLPHDEQLIFLWELLVGFEAPIEMRAWMDGLKDLDNIALLTGQERIQAIVYSALMNPWFLLKN